MPPQPHAYCHPNRFRVEKEEIIVQGFYRDNIPPFPPQKECVSPSAVPLAPEPMFSVACLVACSAPTWVACSAPAWVACSAPAGGACSAPAPAEQAQGRVLNRHRVLRRHPGAVPSRQVGAGAAQAPEFVNTCAQINVPQCLLGARLGACSATALAPVQRSVQCP